MPTSQEQALADFQAKRRTQGTTPVTSPSGNPANMYNTSNPSQTLLQTLDSNTAASNASKENFNSAINLYGGNISSVNNTAGTTANNNLVPTATGTSTTAVTGTNTTGTSVPVITGANTGVTGTDNSPGILTYDELSQDMKTYLDNNPTAKAQFDLQTTYGKQQQAKFLADAEKATVEYKKTQAYNADQAKNQMDRKNIQDAAGERQLRQGINDTTSNTYYSSQSSAPSAIANTAAHGKIVELTKQFDEFVRLNSLEGDAYTKSVAEQARRLQEDLNTKIGETLAEKLTSIDNGVKNGDIATPEQLDRIFKENSAAILKEVPALTNFAVQALSDLQNNFMNTQKELRDNKITFDQNANKYNAEMSQVQGFAVDGNGQQILGANGQPIEIPKESPIKPFFDEKSGQFVTFTTDELTGMIIPHATKVAGYTPTPTAQPQVWGKFDDTHVINQATGEIKAVGSTSSANSSPIPIDSSTIDQALTECRANGQCGEGVNDYLQKLGLPRIFGDSYEQKVSQINSYSPQVGSVAIWNPSATSGKAYGHVAVVTKINGDGTVQVHDWNWDNKGNQKTHDVDMKEITGTGGGYYVPTQTQSQTGPSATVESILNGALNIKDLPTGDREKIGNEVNRYLNETTKNIADQDEVAIRRSAVYTKGMSDTTQQKINKINTVKQQLGDVTALLNEESTGPIIGILKSNNPYDTKAQQIKTAIQALVPNLARGVFGEVGVLTDNDIANYSKTVPNLKSTAELNDAILGMINKTLGKTFTDTVATAAKNRENVSMYLDDYKANLPDSSSANTSSQSSNQNNSNPYGI